MKIKKIVCLSLLFFNVAFSAGKSLILNSPEIAGMFVTFNYVLAGLYKYDRREVDALRVDFGKHGLYYDPAMGPNWWNYYFEPIELGKIDMNNLERYSGKQINDMPIFALKVLPRKEANALINKYVKLKPQINAKVIDFARRHFSGHHIIGVHYRGTDKYKEIRRISYGAAEEIILKAIREAEKSRKKYKIFVATDEQKFLDYMKEKHASKIVHIEAIRSQDGSPVHFRDDEHYRIGEEAILDCLLLSRCSVLVRTASSLSAASEQFNPNIPVMRIGNWQ
jgi:Nodulation protein Z (NodZ)